MQVTSIFLVSYLMDLISLTRSLLAKIIRNLMVVRLMVVRLMVVVVRRRTVVMVVRLLVGSHLVSLTGVRGLNATVEIPQLRRYWSLSLSSVV